MKLTLIFFCLFTLIGCERSKIDSYCCAHPPLQIAFDGGYLTIPNVFTPDGDGDYDWLFFESEGLTDFHLEVKNNMGTVLFTTTDTSSHWESTAKSKSKTKHGIFNYHVMATGIDGTEINEVGIVCVVERYFGKCIENSDNCVFKSNWNGSSFVAEQQPEDFHACP